MLGREAEDDEREELGRDAEDDEREELGRDAEDEREDDEREDEAEREEALRPRDGVASTSRSGSSVTGTTPGPTESKGVVEA